MTLPLPRQSGHVRRFLTSKLIQGHALLRSQASTSYRNRVGTVAFEEMTETTISVCETCGYYIEYGFVGDASKTSPLTLAERIATTEHAWRIAEIWQEGTQFTSGCGQDCEDHGVLAYGMGRPSWEDWLSERELEPWFSTSSCEMCGDWLAGHREHATAYEPATPEVTA